jgi:hypothetical protein
MSQEVTEVTNEEVETGVFIYANLIDSNDDGRIDMISFVDPNGRGVALAVDEDASGMLNQIHVFQDVTGDGKLDGDDVRLIHQEAVKLFQRPDLKEGQLEIFVEEGGYG